MRDITCLMNAKSVALVGASETGMGRMLIDRVVERGFPGPIYPVNPKYSELKGLTCYPSLADLPEAVELVAIVVGAARVNQTLEQAAAIGAKGALIIASGFSEIGEEGAALERQLVETAERLGLVINGPNNLGIASLHENRVIMASSVPPRLKAGEIAGVFASGALALSIENAFIARDVGMSHIITVGNEAQVGFADYLAYLAEDPNAKVIACFVEGFRDPAGFEKAARILAAKNKRIVLLKTGRSELSRRAALAHTGALVGADGAVDAWLKKIGVARVNDIDELIETSILLARYPAIGAGNVGIASVSGGGSGVLADLAKDTGLHLSPFSEDAADRLRKVLPDVAAPNNPLDVTTFGLAEPVLHDILSTLSTDPDLSAMAWAFHTPLVTEERSLPAYLNMIETLGQASQSGTVKPAIAFSMVGGTMEPAFIEMAQKYRLPLIQGARTGLAALAAAQASSHRLALLADPDTVAGPAPAGVSDSIRAAPHRVVSEREMKSLLATAGLPVTVEGPASSEDEAAALFDRLGIARAVLKVESADIPHKSDCGGVILDVASPQGARAAYTSIMRAVAQNEPQAQVDGVLVQEMAGAGTDVFVGCTIEPGIGPILALGAGGVMVEALNQVALAMCPLSAEEAREFVLASPAAAMLRSHRGVPAGDVDALVDTVRRLSHVAWWLRDEITEFDVNPVRVFADGKGVQILDALAVKSDCPAGPIADKDALAAQ